MGVRTTAVRRRVSELGFGRALPADRKRAGPSPATPVLGRNETGVGSVFWPVPAARRFPSGPILERAAQPASREPHEHHCRPRTRAGVTVRDCACPGRDWVPSLKNHLPTPLVEDSQHRKRKIPTSQKSGSGEEERVGANVPSSTPEFPGEAQFDSNVLYFY